MAGWCAAWLPIRPSRTWAKGTAIADNCTCPWQLCPQAVVNERVDYKTLHAEMIAALETQDRWGHSRAAVRHGTHAGVRAACP